MSTALSAQETEQILETIYQISQEFLTLGVTDVEDISGFIGKRELLLAKVQNVSMQQFSNTSKVAIGAWLAKIEAVDRLLAKRFDQILDEKGGALRKIMVSQKVAASYMFPQILDSSGIENEG